MKDPDAELEAILLLVREVQATQLTNANGLSDINRLVAMPKTSESEELKHALTEKDKHIHNLQQQLEAERKADRELQPQQDADEDGPQTTQALTNQVARLTEQLRRNEDVRRLQQEVEVAMKAEIKALQDQIASTPSPTLKADENTPFRMSESPPPSVLEELQQRVRVAERQASDTHQQYCTKKAEVAQLTHTVAQLEEMVKQLKGQTQAQISIQMDSQQLMEELKSKDVTIQELTAELAETEQRQQTFQEYSQRVTYDLLKERDRLASVEQQLATTTHHLQRLGRLSTTSPRATPVPMPLMPECSEGSDAELQLEAIRSRFDVLSDLMESVHDHATEALEFKARLRDPW
eukprot:NODE_2736_length_1106_cov_55.873340_g2611_i0.p1 GENE.NODE_2736_length_1106_cov_55.873340_g2611_i0~~NODE_2736_length_1106_cov_55.873340_g2611_i0.p1  ORF type:complete len:364 (+),score=151.22 NODE_2736_length_1106_cov_55.873340_g2611_i0:45-1094(+)